MCSTYLDITFILFSILPDEPIVRLIVILFWYFIAKHKIETREEETRKVILEKTDAYDSLLSESDSLRLEYHDTKYLLSVKDHEIKDLTARSRRDISNVRYDYQCMIRSKVSTIVGLRNTVSDLESELKEKNEEVDSLTAQNTLLTNQQEQSRSLFRSKDATIAGLRETVSDLESELGEKDEEVESLTAQNTLLTNQQEQSRSLLRSKDATIAGLRDTLSESESNLKRRDQSVQDLRSHNKKLTSKIKKDEKSKSKLDSMLKTKDATISRLEGELCETKVVLSEVGKKRYEMKKELDESKRELNDCMKEMQNQTSVIEEKEKTISLCRGELIEGQISLKELQEAFTELDEREKETQQRFDELNEELKEKITCGVCLDREKQCAIVPCGHLLCKKCLRKVQSRSNHCPNCRIEIQAVTKVYF